MARISFETAQANIQENENSNRVSFFNLKNDGDEAIVRIMHDSVEDFEILTMHKITVGDKTRKVSCVREPNQPTTYCPLCNNNVSTNQSIFIKMIQYENKEGKIVPKAVVWERTISYASKLRDFINEYGPLSDVIFKIKRNGKAGDKATRYEMMFTNPQVYRSELYPKDTELFKDYSALGTIVMDKTYEEIATFLTTGSFPQTNNENNTQPAQVPTNTPPVTNQSYIPTTAPTPSQHTPAQWDNTPVAPQNLPWENSPAVTRPNRQY